MGFFFCFGDNNSEDEGPSAAKVMRSEQEEATKEPQEKDGSMELDSDEADSGELDSEDGRLMGSMSTRSESKPYSSVTHKCEVRNGDLSATRETEWFMLTDKICSEMGLLLNKHRFLPP